MGDSADKHTAHLKKLEEMCHTGGWLYGVCLFFWDDFGVVSIVFVCIYTCQSWLVVIMVGCSYGLFLVGFVKFVKVSDGQ